MLKIKRLALLAFTFITCQLPASLNEQLLEAARRGQTETVKELLTKGANVNAQGRHGQTALLWAAHEGHTKIVRLLLDANADVHIKNNNGSTALIVAAIRGCTEVIQALLQYKAEIKAIDKYGTTALMHAAKWGRKGTVLALLDANADVNAKNYYDENALTHAAQNRHIETISVLLNTGADVHAIDNCRWAAISSTNYQDHGAAAQLIENYISLQQQVSDAIQHNSDISNFIKDILIYDFSLLLKQLLSPEVADLIRKSDELKALIKPNSFIAQLLAAYDYKEKYGTLWLTTRTPEAAGKPWSNLPIELIKEILSY